MTDDKALRWMPQDMPLGDRLDYLAAYPGNPHGAAAAAWEDHAATLQDGDGGTIGLAGVVSVSTGAQSVSYGADGAGSGPRGDALRRASWHRKRARLRAVTQTPGDTEWFPPTGVDEDEQP